VPDVQSRWRDDRTWQQRVARDRTLLRERLDDDQMKVVRGVAEAADTQGALDFCVVFGSVARGDHDDESDLDIYFEAGDLNAPYDIPHPDFPEYQILGLPRNGLADALRGGQEFAFNIVRDALVHVDNGRYRAVLVAAHEEGLAPEEPAGART
jgi:nucleotidyltransferase-like protein